MAKILAVLFPNAENGHPTDYARQDIPTIDEYPDGQSTPTPRDVDFTPGEMLGDVAGELGLRRFLEDQGHTLVVTSDKEGENSEFQREVVDADVVISQPFWPAYLTRELVEKAPNLKLAITAGVGSDHVDLQAAIDHGITVAEVTQSNSISVAEHAVMQILVLVRNFVPSHQWVTQGGWNIADSVERAYDLEGMQAGVLGGGRIGRAVLRRLAPFDVALHYHDKNRLSEDLEKELNLTYHEDPRSLVRAVDVLSVHVPLHPETEGMFDEALLSEFKRGAYLINPARGALVDRDALVRALESGQLGGYAGDVWYPQPPEKDHPWRTAPNTAMTSHMSGATLSAQARYAAGTREILEAFFAGTAIRDEYLIVDRGKLAGSGAKSYTS